MSLGAAIGAITFTGSVIAFLKLSGRMSGKPIILPARHLLNIGLALALVACIVMFCQGAGAVYFWAIALLSLAARHPHHRAHRRRRHAGGDLDAELLFGMGGGRHRLHPRQCRADHHRRAGRLVGRDPVLHHVQGHEPLVHQRHPRRVRRRGGGPGGRRRAEAGQARLGGGRGLPDEECRQSHHRAGLRHGGGASPACVARNGRRAEEGRRRGQICHPPGGRPHARAT